MGLKSALGGAARAGVAALGDVAVSTNYESFTSATYDASTGANVASYATSAGVTLVFRNFSIAQVDGRQVQPEDKRALIPARNISGVTPGVNDRIVAGGSVWEVQRVAADPASALWDLQVRKP